MAPSPFALNADAANLSHSPFCSVERIVGGFNNYAVGRFSAVLGGSQSITGGRHSFTIGSFGRARGDFSGVISVAGSTGCEASEDNELVLCANAVTLVTPSGTVDLAKLARRALTAVDSQDTLQTIDTRRNQNNALGVNEFAPEKGWASLRELDELRQDVLVLRRRIAELEENDGISFTTRKKQQPFLQKGWHGWLSSFFE